MPSCTTGAMYPIGHERTSRVSDVPAVLDLAVAVLFHRGFPVLIDPVAVLAGEHPAHERAHAFVPPARSRRASGPPHRVRAETRFHE